MIVFISLLYLSSKLSIASGKDKNCGQMQKQQEQEERKYNLGEEEERKDSGSPNMLRMGRGELAFQEQD